MQERCHFFFSSSLCSKAMDTTANIKAYPVYKLMYTCCKLSDSEKLGVLVTLLCNEFHCEILQGKKEYKEELCEQKVRGMHYNQFYYGRVQGWR